MTATNPYGRRWDELDSLKAFAHLPGAFSLLSADGLPLCGRVVEGQKPVVYTALGWKVSND